MTMRTDDQAHNEIWNISMHRALELQIEAFRFLIRLNSPLKIPPYIIKIIVYGSPKLSKCLETFDFSSNNSFNSFLYFSSGSLARSRGSFTRNSTISGGCRG